MKRQRLRRRASGLDSQSRAVILTAFYPPAFRGGGPIRTLDALVKASPLDVEVSVVTGDRDLGSPEPLEVARNCWTEWNGVATYYVSARNVLRLASLAFAVNHWRPDTVYLNSFFSVVFSILPQLLRKAGWCRYSRVLLAPRGEFSTGALEIRPARKKAYILAYRRLGLAKNVFWHASSDFEAADIRAIFGCSARICIRENETQLPPDPMTPVRSRPGPLRLVFLSRLSAKKGLDVLLEALRAVTSRVNLDIYGPDGEPSYVSLCRKLAQDLPTTVCARFRGPICPSQVRAVLANYDLMVLPTAGENFGHVIAEALSVSCPVMCSDSTPWTDKLNAGGGTAVRSQNLEAWSSALEEYAGLSLAERYERRQKAGDIYRTWRCEAKGPHIFEMFRKGTIDNGEAEDPA